jgi:fumarylpyruvate hydrolase
MSQTTSLRHQVAKMLMSSHFFLNRYLFRGGRSLLHQTPYTNRTEQNAAPFISSHLLYAAARPSAAIMSEEVEFVFPPPQRPSVPVVVSDHNKQQNHEGAEKRNFRFPVHRVYCVARNFADHVHEMGGNVERDPPFFFTKPPDAIVCCGISEIVDCSDTRLVSLPFPSAPTQDFHHEVELVVAIGKKGFAVTIDDAPSLIYGYAVGIDLTRRDVQAMAKKEGKPWDTAKGFDYSAPIGNIYPVDAVNIVNRSIWLTVNGELRQKGTTSELIWSVPEVISHLSHEYMLQPGDLIFTGTPAGVGPLHVHDTVQATVDGVGELAFTVTEPLAP